MADLDEMFDVDPLPLWTTPMLRFFNLLPGDLLHLTPMQLRAVQDDSESLAKSPPIGA